jgi:hypothetical protein
MHYTKKAYGAREVLIHIFLTSAQIGGELSASRPGHCTPGEKSTGVLWIGSWVDPRPGVNVVEKKTFLTPPRLDLVMRIKFILHLYKDFTPSLTEMSTRSIKIMFLGSKATAGA